MITGAHVLLYSHDAEADRAFFRDVLELHWVDAGHGWLIFKLPPAEAALHPTDGDPAQGYAPSAMLGAELYLMCDDLQASIESLAAKNVVCAPIDKAPWGIKTTIRLPSGGAIGLYQPTHPTALGL
jgi:catechol 2,3-dioxygenase-like lactoylglutathione lyase family enzyme